MIDIKLIAADMDGTLLDSNKKLSPRFREVYETIRNAGATMAIASGRQYYSLLTEFEFFPHDLIFIADNGGYIKFKDRVLMPNPFVVEKVYDLIDAVRADSKTDLVLSAEDGAYYESTNEAFVKEMKLYYSRSFFVDDLKAVKANLLKVAVCNLHDMEAHTLPFVRRHRADFVVSMSSRIWVDVMPVGIDKGQAVRFIQKELGLLPEQTMLFGDYLNDYQMLQTGHYSYAMENAHIDLKKIARFIAPSNDKDGVMQVISSYFKK